MLPYLFFNHNKIYFSNKKLKINYFINQNWNHLSPQIGSESDHPQLLQSSSLIPTGAKPRGSLFLDLLHPSSPSFLPAVDFSPYSYSCLLTGPRPKSLPCSNNQSSTFLIFHISYPTIPPTTFKESLRHAKQNSNSILQWHGPGLLWRLWSPCHILLSPKRPTLMSSITAGWFCIHSAHTISAYPLFKARLTCFLCSDAETRRKFFAETSRALNLYLSCSIYHLCLAVYLSVCKPHRL